MAYVNVAEWKTDQVCEWLKGLDNSVLPYVHSFTNNCVNGQQLLNLRPECLEKLGVIKLGHQEIILEAVEYLRNFHYDLDRENLQLLALRLSCQSHSLYNELSRQTDSRPVTTQTLADVASVVTAVKPLVRWLDRPPFSGQLEYNDRKSELLKLSLEMATCAQRDRFAEKPIEEIRSTCEQLAKLADYVIQDIADPMILQPASLDLATLKKRPGDDLGFRILPSFHGNHQIAEIKFGSAAHSCGKMEEGDEIVQVNYQTVVGWERKNVLELFTESPAEVLLTLKRRPRHTKVYGQIYIKPYRLPSNKKTPYATRWQHNLPSPRPELLTIPDFTMPLPRSAPKEPSPEPTSITDRGTMLDPMLASDSSGGSDSEEVEPISSTRLYASKPRNLVQRRATITGASPTTKHWIDIEELWMELKQKHSTSFQMRDKAASCAHGLDNVQQSANNNNNNNNNRPQTCLGIEQQSKRKKRNEEQQQRNSDERRVQFHDKAADVGKIEESTTTTTRITNDRWTSSNGSEKKEVPSDKLEQEEEEEEEEEEAAAAAPPPHDSGRNEIVYRGRKERGKLDKSHSAPAYDPGDSNLSEHVIGKIRAHDDAKCPSSINANETDDTTVRNDTLDTREPIEGHENCADNEVSENVGTRGDDESANVTEQGNFDDKTKKFVTDCHSDVLPVVARILQEHGERESSEEKSESTSSYVEYSSSSSEADVNLKTMDPRSSSSNNSMAATNRRLREIKEEDASRSSRPEGPTNSASHNHQTKNDRPEVHKREYHQSPRQGVDSGPETTRRLEAKPRLTPPEPPPRKYFSKPPRDPLPSVPDARELQPEVTETRLEHRRLERSTEDNFPKDFEGYRDFVEKSTDFIDEPTTSGHENRSAITDLYGYTEIIHEANSAVIRDDKCERYETVREKFTANGNVPVGETIEFSGSRDSPDGSACSRLPRTPDPKPKSLENKDRHGERGVVNRAMMVARSIGLHAGGSGKSSGNGSPRSSRKRNLLLAKRRNVSVKDVGPGDLEGWLTYRSRGAGGAWARSWFVLKASSLYRFKAQDSTKSDCLIALPGFTASTAAEVKSRKYAFKVYHTGTVFYFAADTEDSLTLWLDSINKATLGADSQNRTSGLFSETDESDSEGPKNTNKSKPSTAEMTSTKSCHETTMFGSLKKIGRNKDNSSYKEHENLGASLDRKYLRFLGSRNQNVPVPTAQFRSYRRVLPTSTPNRKQESTPNSPDLRVTVAGSTFYGLSASQSATDVPSTSQDMGDYRQTTDRSQSIRGVVVGGRRSDDLRGFITLEEFMLAHQSEDRRGTMIGSNNNNNNVGSLSSSLTSSPRVTPLTSDHVHIHHRNFDAEAVLPGRAFVELALSNGMIYGHPRNGEDAPSTIIDNSRQRENDNNSRKSHVGSFSHGRKEGAVYYPNRHHLADSWQNATNEITNDLRVHANSHKSDNGQTRLLRGNRDSPTPAPRCRNDQQRHRLCNDTINEQYQTAHLAEINAQSTPRRFVRDNGYVGSSGDLTCCASSSSSSSETLQRARKEVTRKGSFNLVDRRRDRHSPDKHWMDSLRRSDKKTPASVPLAEKARLKNVAQYQPPPIPSSPFEQDGMRAAFEMHLDKGTEPVQKTNRLKSLFGGGGGGGGGGKSPQKPNTLDLPKDSPKTLLGSPRLHRALFRDKSTSGQPQRQAAVRSGSQSPGDSGISQSLSSYSGNSQSHTLSQSFSSVSSVSDWSPDTPTPNAPKCSMGHAACQKRFSNASSRSSMTPPTLPYIPPPTSPPPDDYPGLEYPPVFEPGTYSLTDPSLMRNRSNKTAPSKPNRENENPE